MCMYRPAANFKKQFSRLNRGAQKLKPPNQRLVVFCFAGLLSSQASSLFPPLPSREISVVRLGLSQEPATAKGNIRTKSRVDFVGGGWLRVPGGAWARVLFFFIFFYTSLFFYF